MANSTHIGTPKASAGTTKRVRLAAAALHTTPQRVIGLAVSQFFRDIVSSTERLNDLRIVLADVDEDRSD